MGFCSGQGVKCYTTSTCTASTGTAPSSSADTPLCNYLISCGSNIEASGGVVGIWRHSRARERGMKRVQVEPHLSVTGACSAQWVPLKPKSDAAFLFALIHVMLHESARGTLDLEFLARRTGSPYLVGPNGYFLRERASRKPLVWDRRAARPAPRSAGITEALEGSYEVDAIETGADGEVLAEGLLRGETAFTRMVQHMAGYTPEWAAASATSRPRRSGRCATSTWSTPASARPSRSTASTLPYRPVAVTLGKTVNNGWGGYECCWARTVLATLVGALEVPGGTIGTTVRLGGRCRSGWKREAGRRRLHALPAEPDRQGHWSARPTSATPTAPWCRWRATAPGARRWARPTSPGCSSTQRRRACRA
jgi:phenylacetyl-CoA:acceptor oxidoreductase